MIEPLLDSVNPLVIIDHFDDDLGELLFEKVNALPA